MRKWLNTSIKLCKFRTRLIFVQQINLLVYFLHHFYKSDLLGDCTLFVVGYRLHTLSVIDAHSGQSFPLVSLVAPANHHDSHFLPFLVKLAQAMGIDIQRITADEASHDKDGSLFNETGVISTTPPSSTVPIPGHVTAKTGKVFAMVSVLFPCTISVAMARIMSLNVRLSQGKIHILIDVPNIARCFFGKNSWQRKKKKVVKEQEDEP